MEFATDLHLATFPENVIGRFGPGLLRAHYLTLAQSPHATAQIATMDGRAVGYLVGVYDTTAHQEWTRGHRFRALVAAALPALLKHPRLAAGLLCRRATLRLRSARARVRVVARPGRSTGEDHPSSAGGLSRESAERERVAVLLHVAVRPAARGLGVGDRLISHFEDGATTYGATRLCLATSDAGPGAMYEKRGWTKVRSTQTFDGRTIHLYERAPL